MAGTNTNVVSYLGELFRSGRRPNNFLKMIGGIQGGVMETTSRQFPVAVLYSLRAPSQSYVAEEGANAPTAQTRSLTQATNVIEIHQETVQLTYLGSSEKAVGGIVPLPQGAANGPVQNPRSEAWQVMTAMDTISQDLNFAFVQGVYANPSDATASALQTRGITSAIVTNLVDNSAVTASAVTDTIYRGYIEALVQQVVISNGYNPDETWTFFGDATQYANIQAAYEAQGTIYLQPETEFAGIKIRRILTRYGTVNIVLEPDMPANQVLLADLRVVSPVGMAVPGKGILFAEPLAKTGSADNIQIYGQLGLDHGPEFCHGLLKVPNGLSL
jgi:hypothetical protein